jgi:hypothetical protein
MAQTGKKECHKCHKCRLCQTPNYFNPMTYEYILEPYRGMASRHHCPACKNREKTFSLYIDSETGKHIDPLVGRCNRESNCGYHYTPKQYFQDHPSNNENNQLEKATCKQKATVSAPKPASYIPTEVFKASLKNYDSNNFVIFLINLFGIDVTNQLISKYFIGTSKYWLGATVFWQIDNLGRARTGKVMLYDPQSGKRVKEPYNHITWSHKALKLDAFELKQCLFGQHLLKDISRPVAVVESEKSSIIASVYMPQFIWIAVGSLANLNEERCLALQSRDVILFPDLNGFEKWSGKAKELSHLANFTVSDLLERKATNEERGKGLDIADYLIRFDHRKFIDLVPKQEPIFKSDMEASSYKLQEELQIQSLSEEQPMKHPGEAILPIKKVNPMAGYQTYGHVFDLLKARGYKTLPPFMEISIDGWN